MGTPASTARVLRFAVFEVDLRAGQLRKNGRRVSLQEKPFQILASLLEQPGDVVTREELRRRLWPGDVFVDFDQGLNNAIKKLRVALDDSAETPRFVETLPRRGYRFLAPVEAVDGVGSFDQPPARARRGWSAAVALAVALGVALYATRERWLPNPRPAQNVMLAVLPLDNLSGDPEQEYLSDGMTEELIAQVGRLHPDGLGVIGRASAMHYKKTSKRADEIGRELGVDYILSGSVRRAGVRLRVTAELVRVRDHLQLWNQSYDRELRDMIDLQSEIARAIAAEVPLSLRNQGRVRAAPSRPVEPEAYESYLRGLYSWSRWTLDSQRNAIAHFQKALARDPAHAAAWAFLGSALTLSAHMRGLPPREAMVKARAALSRALELDPTLPEAHSHDGWLKLTYEWDFEGARQAFERALTLNPSLANAQQGLSLYLAALGRAEESVVEMQRARDLDPLSVPVGADLCLVLYYARRYEEALAQCHRALEMDPGSLPAHVSLRWLYSVQGRHDEAIEEEVKVMRVNFGAEPWFGEWSQRLRSAYRSSGWAGARRQQIAWMLSAAPPQQGLAYAIAEEYALLGDTRNALDWLEKACDERRYRLAFLKAEPIFDRLRADPRFRRIAVRIGLPP